MASFSCHAFGVSKRFRLERIVRPQAYAAKWPMASVMARQTETYARLTAARAGQGLPERSSPEARPSNTPTPRKKNQGVKRNAGAPRTARDRKSVVQGKRVSVRVDRGGRRIIKKKQQSKRASQQKRQR